MSVEIGLRLGEARSSEFVRDDRFAIDDGGPDLYLLDTRRDGGNRFVQSLRVQVRTMFLPPSRPKSDSCL